jgi:hypothetical protein
MYEAVGKWFARTANATSLYGVGEHAAQLRAVAQQQLANYELRAALHPAYRLSSIEMRVLPELDDLQAGRNWVGPIARIFLGIKVRPRKGNNDRL